MADVATSYKRLFVRNLLWVAEESGDTLYDTLKAAAKARIQQTQTGKVLVGTSGNGHAVNFDVPKDFTPTEAAELIAEIFDRYEESKAKLIGTDEIASPNDQQIHDEILDKLRPIRSIAYDFSGLRGAQEEVTT